MSGVALHGEGGRENVAVKPFGEKRKVEGGLPWSASVDTPFG